MKLANLKSWDNVATLATPEGVAEVFALQNLSNTYQKHLAAEALRLFRDGDAAGAKAVCDRLPRSEFGSSQEYFVWAQFKALFLKSSRDGDEDKRRTAAKKKFFEAERTCKRVNKRLSFYDKYPNRENPLMRSILTRSKQLISKVLGNFTEDTLEHLLTLSRPGGGTTIGTIDPLKVTNPFKLGVETRLYCTRECLPYARMLVEGSPCWLRSIADIDWASRRISVPYVEASGNRIAYVPKDAATMRTIAVEPHLNLCLQLGVHDYVSRRLISFGVDIHDQTRNQELARKGALEWQRADPSVTLDLSAASDSLSVALVERLLPTTWCDYLRCLRSHSFTMEGGKSIEYQKWSSMGNGYTFVLETLIFWAIAQACKSWTTSSGVVSAYGDDIIVPRGAAALLIEALKYVGFSVNIEKTAIFGPFRESCGEDWWSIDRVVPLYLREMARLRKTDIYRIMNLLDNRRFVVDECRKYVLRAHKGVPILYGLSSKDPSACIWTNDMVMLHRQRLIRWNWDFHAWEQQVAHFRPHKVKVKGPAGFAAALLGDRKITDAKVEAKSTLRRRGTWCLVRTIAG